MPPTVVLSTKHFVGPVVYLEDGWLRAVKILERRPAFPTPTKEHHKNMNSRTKRILSTIAIVIASVAFGVVISADLGLMRKSNAQSAPIQTTSGSGTVTTVSVP